MVATAGLRHSRPQTTFESAQFLEAFWRRLDSAPDLQAIGTVPAPPPLSVNRTRTQGATSVSSASISGSPAVNLANASTRTYRHLGGANGKVERVSSVSYIPRCPSIALSEDVVATRLPHVEEPFMTPLTAANRRLHAKRAARREHSA